MLKQDQSDQEFEKKDKSMLGRVSEQLKKLPFSVKDRIKIQQDIPHITMMNLPPITAKRDAAYDVAVGLLSSNISSRSSGELMLLYTDALKLLTISEKAHDEIIKVLSRIVKKSNVNAHSVYLKLFSDMLSAALFLLNSSSHICADEETVANYLNTKTGGRTVEFLKVFSSTENELRNVIIELYESAGQAVMKERKKIRSHFSDDGAERYEKSYKEFLTKFD